MGQDGNGEVDIEEIKKWGEDLRGKPYTPEEVDRILKSFDADGGFDEAVSAVRSAAARWARAARDASGTRDTSASRRNHAPPSRRRLAAHTACCLSSSSPPQVSFVPGQQLEDAVQLMAARACIDCSTRALAERNLQVAALGIVERARRAAGGRP